MYICVNNIYIYIHTLLKDSGPLPSYVNSRFGALKVRFEALYLKTRKSETALKIWRICFWVPGLKPRI